MPKRKRADLTDKVGADFFRSDKKTDTVIESKSQKVMTDKQQKMKTTFYIPADLHRKLRIECAEQGVRISSFIENLLSKHFDSKKS